MNQRHKFLGVLMAVIPIFAIVNGILVAESKFDRLIFAMIVLAICQIVILFLILANYKEKIDVDVKEIIESNQTKIEKEMQISKLLTNITTEFTILVSMGFTILVVISIDLFKYLMIGWGIMMLVVIVFIVGGVVRIVRIKTKDEYINEKLLFFNNFIGAFFESLLHLNY